MWKKATIMQTMARMTTVDNMTLPDMERIGPTAAVGEDCEG